MEYVIALCVWPQWLMWCPHRPRVSEETHGAERPWPQTEPGRYHVQSTGSPAQPWVSPLPYIEFIDYGRQYWGIAPVLGFWCHVLVWTGHNVKGLSRNQEYPFTSVFVFLLKFHLRKHYLLPTPYLSTVCCFIGSARCCTCRHRRKLWICLRNVVYSDTLTKHSGQIDRVHPIMFTQLPSFMSSWQLATC